MSAPEYIITFRERLEPAELLNARDLGPVSIDEVTPAGWTRRIYTREETRDGLDKAD